MARHEASGGAGAYNPGEADRLESEEWLRVMQEGMWKESGAVTSGRSRSRRSRSRARRLVVSIDRSTTCGGHHRNSNHHACRTTARCRAGRPATTGLRATSFVKMRGPGPIHKTNLKSRIGRLPQIAWPAVEARICRVLGIQLSDKANERRRSSRRKPTRALGLAPRCRRPPVKTWPSSTGQCSHHTACRSRGLSGRLDLRQ